MRKSSWAGAGIFALGIGFLVFVYFPGNGSDSDIKELYDFSSNGLELNVVTNGEDFTDGDEILVEATLKNDLGAPVTYDKRCGEPISIEVKAVAIDNELIQKNKIPECNQEEKEPARMISNEQLSKSAQFELKIPLSENEAVLTPSGQYKIIVTFYPLAQPEFMVEIPIEISQKNNSLITVNEAKQVALQSTKAQVWFEKYRDSENYIVSEDLPYLEDGEWVFKWHAMHADQSDTSPDEELILYQNATNKE